MVPEAPLEQTEFGRVPKGEGWFVVNAKESRWLEHDVVERTRREVDLPMTHVVVDLDAERAAAAPRSSAA